jgi:hypothetical protein
MFTKTMFAIVTLVAAIATLGIVAGALAADARQLLAPGHTGFNPGQENCFNTSNTCDPPGQQFILGNPGQCQKDLQEPPFSIDKKVAHDICHTNVK